MSARSGFGGRDPSIVGPSACIVDDLGAHVSGDGGQQVAERLVRLRVGGGGHVHCRPERGHVTERAELSTCAARSALLASLRASRAASFAFDQTKVQNGTLVRVMAWYDNEWGFSNRMADTAVAMGQLL